VKDISFNSNGDKIAIATSSYVSIWNMENPTKMIHRFSPHDSNISSVVYFGYKKDSNRCNHLMLTGAKNNSELKIWNTNDWTCLHTFTFYSPEEPNQFQGDIDFDDNYEFLFVGRMMNKSMYVLHILYPSQQQEEDDQQQEDEVEEGQRKCRFDYIAEFILQENIISFIVAPQQATKQSEDIIYRLFCAQLKSIQSYGINYKQCYDSNRSKDTTMITELPSSKEEESSSTTSEMASSPTTIIQQDQQKKKEQEKESIEREEQQLQEKESQIQEKEQEQATAIEEDTKRSPIQTESKEEEKKETLMEANMQLLTPEEFAAESPKSISSPRQTTNNGVSLQTKEAEPMESNVNALEQQEIQEKTSDTETLTPSTSAAVPKSPQHGTKQAAANNILRRRRASAGEKEKPRMDILNIQGYS
jgi:hypothetical protein